MSYRDELAYAIRWVETSGSFCEVTAEQVGVNPDHPMVGRLRTQPEDTLAVAFVASAVYSAINAYYSEITDADELTMQRQFLSYVRQSLAPARG